MKVEIKDNRKDKPKGIKWVSNHVYRATTDTGKEVIVICHDDDECLTIFEDSDFYNMDKDDFDSERYTLSEDITDKVKIIFEIN